MNERDLRMMQNPNNWPIWPQLPLKNNRDRQPGTMPRLGFLFDRSPADETPDIRFIESNLFSTYSADDIAAAPVANIAALVDAGWVVD